MTIYVYVGNELEVRVIFMTIQDQIQLLYKCDYKTVSYPRPSQQKLAMNQPQWAEIAGENQWDVTRKKSDAMGSQTRNQLTMTAYPVAGDICEADMTDIYLYIYIFINLSIVLSLSCFIYLIYLFCLIYHILLSNLIYRFHLIYLTYLINLINLTYLIYLVYPIFLSLCASI